jgi:cyanophycinase
MRARVLTFLIVFLLAVAGPLKTTDAQTGKGSLIISGGGGLSRGDLGTGVVEKFVSLAGGPDANYVYIPTASSGTKLDNGFIYEPPNSDLPAANTAEFEQELAKMFGVKRITIMHTRSRVTANSAKFVEPLRKAGGVWISGGNAGRLASTFLGTRIEKEIRAVFERGGVVGGNSAGAIIQGSFIVRGIPGKPVLMARGHESGFGFLMNVAINPHLITAKREDELVGVVDQHPELLGIGIDEKAAILVRGSQFEVLGDSKVAIYDNQKHENRWYFWLTPGTLFDLRTRTIVKRGVEAPVK